MTLKLHSNSQLVTGIQVTTRLLLIENSPDDRDLIQNVIRTNHINIASIEWCSTLASGLDCLRENHFDILLLDFSLPDGNGLDSILMVQDVSAEIPIVVISDLDDDAIALKAVEEGAQDYLVKKNIDDRLLDCTVQYAIQRKKLAVRLQQSELNYRNLIENNTDCMIVFDKVGRFLYINPAADAQFGANAIDVIRKMVNTNKGSLDPREIELVGKGKKRHAVEVKILETYWARNPAFLALIHDVTEAKRSSEFQRIKSSTEELVNKITSEFINISPEQASVRIDHSLRAIGEYFHLARAYIVQFYDNGRLLETVHHWNHPKETPTSAFKSGTSIDRYPWLIGKIREMAPVELSNSEGLPPEINAERKRLQPDDTKISVYFPLTHDGSVFGFAGVDFSDEKRRWSPETVSVVKKLATVFSGALMHKRALESVLTRERFLTMFFENNLTCFFVTDPCGKLVSCNPGFVRTFGYASLDDALESNITKLFASLDRCNDFLDAINAKKTLECYDVEMVNQAGSQLQLLGSISGTFSNDGRLVEIRAYLIDITKWTLTRDLLSSADNFGETAVLDERLIDDFYGRLKALQQNFNNLAKDPMIPENVRLKIEVARPVISKTLEYATEFVRHRA